MKKWQTLDSKVVFDNPWMRIRRDKVKLPIGKVLDDYFIWQKGDVVIAVPVTSKKEFIFVRQYRQGVGDFMIEFPTGFLNKGEDPITTAKRELLEETGCQGKIKLIGKLYGDSDKIAGKINVCLVKNIKPAEIFPGTVVNFEDNEEIEILKLPFKKVLKMISQGEIWATETVAAFFLALEKLGLLKLVK